MTVHPYDGRERAVDCIEPGCRRSTWANNGFCAYHSPVEPAPQAPDEDAATITRQVPRGGISSPQPDPPRVVSVSHPSAKGADTAREGGWLPRSSPSRTFLAGPIGDAPSLPELP